MRLLCFTFPMHIFCTTGLGKGGRRDILLWAYHRTMSCLWTTPPRFKKVTLLGDLRHAMTCHGLVILALAYHVELQNGHVVWLHTMLSIGNQPKACDCQSE